MTNTVTIACRIGTTDASASLGFEAWVDQHKFFDTDHLTASEIISVEVDDATAEHELRFVLKNKNQTHTKIDGDGNILTDSFITIKDVTFDDIKIGHTLTELATYQHDFNGTGAETIEKFFGFLGCNGVVSLRFTTPLYMWWLEHM
jgi:hypothetical protein